MNPRVEGDSRTVKPFKFSDSFLAGFNSLITTYDKKIEDLNKVKSLIDKDAHHGVCNCSYKMRYITPSDISTFISNLERAMENHLFKPHTSDCDLFAVESVKRFLKDNGCVPFDAPSIMGNPGADVPKGATLTDLTFAAESECFNLLVYSKYELDKRVDCMREDVGKIQNMHFSAAVKAFVQKIPGIMDKKASFVMSDSLLAKACEVYIEDFIMFALRLNLCTVLQMLAYAVPRVAYKNEPASDQSNESANNADNWDENNDFFQQEAVDSTQVSPVFFVFTQGKSPVISKAIKKATDSDYSHISISFDASLDNMYSFGGTSFRKESIHDNKRKDLDIQVFGTFITKDAVEKMKDLCGDFITNVKKTSFDYPALVKKLFGSDKKDNSGYKQICTTFVNRLLALAGTNLSEKNIPSPEEMRETAQSKPDQIFELFSGNSTEYKRQDATKKLKAMGKDPNAKRFDEVVTECCTGFLKTNDYVITNKIPFNCNMRDVVLQDMHPQFKDTVSALKFIMNDERSPVHQLVIQYYTEPIDEYDPEQIIKMFFGCPRHNHWECEPNSRDALANNAANMNTDVNWLDKITYGNMFYDGNYRRDGLGNQHTHPIMNSFDAIYKMFGGCDNVCDNQGLANSLIRISRVMKAIVERYCDGSIPNWEMCRDILSVFGEIFTRHMLRLYYNNNRHIIAKDQINDTIVPGYMFAEGYVLEANGFTSQNDQNKVKQATKTTGNFAKRMIEWFRDKLATFLPNYFQNSLQKQCEWFNKNGEAKYNEILKANTDGQYKFPKKDKYYHYNITFDPSNIDVPTILKKYVDDENKDLVEMKKELMNAFPNAQDKEIASKLASADPKQLPDQIKNAILFSNTEGGQIDTDYEIKAKPDWEEIYETMKFMCEAGQDGKCRGGKWSEDMVKLSNSLQKAVKDLQSEVDAENKASENKTEVQQNSYTIKLDGSVFQEGDPVTPEPQNNAQQTKSTGRKEAVLKELQNVASSFYVTSLNTIVKDLFTDVYNNFKGVIDDYETMKNGGTDANAQQGANNTNNVGTPTGQPESK